MTTQSKNVLSRRRQGALTLELVLIFPILMLLFVLFYQVAVMLVTYHSLQTTVTHAAAMASSPGTTIEDISTVINNGTDSWFYGKNTPQRIGSSNSENWNSYKSGLMFRILKKEDGNWRYAEEPLSDGEIMVEVKLPGLKGLGMWLMPQFKGVGITENDASFTVSAMGLRQ